MTTTAIDDFTFLDMTPIGDDPIEDKVVAQPKVDEPIIEETFTEEDLVLNGDNKVIDTDGSDPTDFVPNDSKEDPLIAIANGMLNKGFFREIPTDIDPTQFSEEAFWKTFEHNSRLQVDEAIKNERELLASSITNTTRDILSYDIENPNATEEEIVDFLQSTIYARQITSLDPEKAPEQVIRQYYNSVGWTAAEIDAEVVELVERDKLVDKAKSLKPKLDLQAQAITEDKIRQQRLITDQEAKQYNSLRERTIQVLNTGKLFDVELTREEAHLAYNAILNQDVEVPVRGGKTVKLGAMEALVYKHRYDPSGSIENLMLAAIVMEKGPEAIEKYLGKKANTKVVEQFVRDNRASVASKTGAVVNNKRNTENSGLFRLKVN